MVSCNPVVSIVMPVRNEGPYICRSIEAILQQNYPLNLMEIIITDGLSTDQTREIIREFESKHPNMRVIDNPQKIVAPGLNEAIKQAKGDIIIRVDGHCVIAPDYVSQCVRLLQEKNVDAVGGPIETIGETFIAKAIAIAMSSWFGVGGSAFRTIRDKEMEVETVPFPAYPKTVFEKIGYFDEELVRNQDDEFNYRLREAGGKVFLSPSIRSCYYSRGSLGSLWRQYFQYGYWKVRVMQKHPKQIKLRQVIPFLFILSVIFFLGVGILTNAWGLFLGILVGYALTNFGASLIAGFGTSFNYIPILPIIYAILHISYGVGFGVGLIKFRNQWTERKASVVSRDKIDPQREL